MRTLTRLLRSLLISIGVVALATSGATLAGAQETNDQETQRSIEAKALDDHECDDTEWHFVITQVRDEASAPGSISVAFSDGADTLTLDKFTGGVAHYSTTGHLDATVESATAEIYEGWSGQFNLSHGPCDDEEPEEGDVAPALDLTPEPVIEDDEPVEVGGDEVVADERAETTTAVQGDQQVAAEDVENRAVEDRADQPETPEVRETAVLGSQAERGALPRTGADSTLALALVGAMMLATGFGLQRVGSRAGARS